MPASGTHGSCRLMSPVSDTSVLLSNSLLLFRIKRLQFPSIQVIAVEKEYPDRVRFYPVVLKVCRQTKTILSFPYPVISNNKCCHGQRIIIVFLNLAKN